MISLEPVTIADLRDLSASTAPGRLAGHVLQGALPPAFVARRSLDQLRSGKPTRWCSTFYMREPDGSVVGGCGFNDAPLNRYVEIGYAVSPLRRNRGIATAAIALLVSIAFASGEVDAVVACIDARNGASIRVVEKLGFTCLANGIDPTHDMDVHWVLRTPSSTPFKPLPRPCTT